MSMFAYIRASDSDAARAAFEAASDARFLAGGQTLLPVIKQRLAEPDVVVSLRDIADLQGICADGQALAIGAMTTHASVAASDLVKDKLPALAYLASVIGDPAVRNRGTIGGSLANNDPAADYPAALLALNGTVETDRRRIAADDFFDGMFTTTLEDGELIKAVHFPAVEKAGYAKFANPASGYAMVGVMVARTAAGDVRVAVTGAGPGVFRVAEMEQALVADFQPGALDGIAVPADDLNTDMHGSAHYRAHLVTVMARRAVAQAVSA